MLEKVLGNLLSEEPSLAILTKLSPDILEAAANLPGTAVPNEQRQSMKLPASTAADPLLMRSDNGRDPLGLLPVRSEFGRHVVPYLAGPVAQIRGITAVPLIH